MKPLLTIFFLSLFTLSIGQPQDLNFERIGSAQGLSQGNVHFLFKDEEGFVWACTQEGLNRFDGTNFKVYLNDSEDSLSLSNNYVWLIFEDSEGGFWIGTFGGGMNYFNKETEKFERYYPATPSANAAQKNSVRAFVELPENELWVGCDDGMYIFDSKKRVFKDNSKLEQEWKKHSIENFFHLEQLDDQYLLSVTSKGLFKIDVINQLLIPVKLRDDLHLNASYIFKENETRFWIGTGEGLLDCKYDHSTKDFGLVEHIVTDEAKKRYLPSPIIHSIMKDKSGTLWISTPEGLAFMSNDEKKEIYGYSYEASNQNSISNNLVYRVCEIEEGILWAGTREGINQFTYKDPPFHTIKFDPEIKILCSNSILGMTEDNSGNLLVATRAGLTIIRNFDKEPITWNFECHDEQSNPNIKNSYMINVKEIDNEYWLAYRRNGFSILKTDETGVVSFERPSNLVNEIGSFGTSQFIKDSKGNYWIGSSGKSLIRWDRTNDTYTQFPADPNDTTNLNHPYIFALLEDSSGQIWIGAANGGLCKYIEEENQFISYVNEEGNNKSLSNNMVLMIIEDSKGQLLIGTPNGLNIMQKEGEFKRYFTKDGLPNNLIYGIVEDDDGYYWISTNKGLAKVMFSGDSLVTKVFTIEDGIQNNDFNQYSFYKTKDGRICFGGTGGLTVFRPEDVVDNPILAKPIFLDFKLFNQSVKIEKGSILEEHINYEEKITLRYDQNFLSFEFGALSYKQLETNSFAYKMKGIEENWNYVGQRRFAGYPNLSPGQYEFQIKAANNDGIWNEDLKSVEIEITPPPWKTFWAYLIYLLAIGGLILGYIRMRISAIKRIEEAKEKEREIIRKRSSRDFHDQAGNKITKISLLAEMIKRKENLKGETQSMLKDIENNVQDLRTGMKDFIWVLDPSHDNLYATFLHLVAFGNNFFEHSDIEFGQSGMDDNLKKVELNGQQRRNIIMIFKEAMNNSAKYASPNNVSLEYQSTESGFQLSLKDNGTGFNINEEKRGYGLANMRDRAHKINGKLSIESHPQSGTNVVLQLSEE